MSLKNIFITIVIILIGCKSSGKTTTYNEFQGCTDTIACNYNSDATSDDGSCEYEVDCAGVCGGGANVDVCGDCGGNINVEENCPIIWNIYYDISQAIAGFEFTVIGVTITNILGGAAEDAGISQNFNPANGKVVAFSFSLNLIPPGTGILTQIEYDGNIENACISCEDLVISDSTGHKINVIILDDCKTIQESELDCDNENGI